MMSKSLVHDLLTLAGVALAGLIAPLALPDYQVQIAMLWVMVLLAMTWDLVGGQMGYNSFGNVIFFGIGMYAAGIAQRLLYDDVAKAALTPAQYLIGLGVGSLIGAIACAALAGVLGYGILRLRGHYFSMCTLGLGVAVAELASGIEAIGGASGMTTPIFPSALSSPGLFFSYAFFALFLVTFALLRWLYATRFGLCLNAIRDDEDKAEAMGIRTTRYKTVAWCLSALILALTGAGTGHLIGFIDPLDVAFSAQTFGVWMVLMVLLGGKGTFWGPILGAVVFHVSQEVLWSTLFSWHRITLGLAIVAIVIFFPFGILGWVEKSRAARRMHRGRHAAEMPADGSSSPRQNEGQA